MFSCRGAGLCAPPDPVADTVKVNLGELMQDETDKNSPPVQPTAAELEAEKPQQQDGKVIEATPDTVSPVAGSPDREVPDRSPASRSSAEVDENNVAEGEQLSPDAFEAEQLAPEQGAHVTTEELAQKEDDTHPNATDKDVCSAAEDLVQKEDEAQKSMEETSCPLAEEKQQPEECRRNSEIDRQNVEAQQKAEADKQRVDAFLKEKGFTGINAKRKSMLKWKLPLHSAVKLNDPELVRALLQSGADPSLPNSSGQTALQSAAKYNKKGSHSPVIELLPAA